MIFGWVEKSCVGDEGLIAANLDELTVSAVTRGDQANLTVGTGANLEKLALEKMRLRQEALMQMPNLGFPLGYDRFRFPNPVIQPTVA